MYRYFLYIIGISYMGDCMVDGNSRELVDAVRDSDLKVKSCLRTAQTQTAEQGQNGLC
jgi:hypothetical protein